MMDFFSSLDVNVVLTYAVALAIVIGTRVISPIISRAIIYIFHKLLKVKRKVTESGFYEPLKTMITVIGIGIAIYYLQLPNTVIDIYNRCFKILLILSIAKAFANCLKPNSTLFDKLESKNRLSENEVLNIFLSNVLRIVIYIIAGFMIINDFGYNLGGLATGLGIGSAVVALAAQDFVKSLIGGFAIISDKTFEIGDYVIIGEYAGTVEDISFRSTRIRGIDKTLITIPNSLIIASCVVNWSRQDSRLINMRIRLDLKENSQTINKTIDRIKIIFKNNEHIIKETVAVTLDTIDTDANIVSAIAYMDTASYSVYREVKENLNYEILKALENENIELVYPTQKVYTKLL